jgi:hypothetical protein
MQDYILEVGDAFTASEVSPLSGDWRVKERFQQGDFCYYACTSLDGKCESVFRNKDVGAETIKKPNKKWCRFSCTMGTALRSSSIHSYFDFENIYDVFERLKKYYLARYPTSRSFMIESDQDCEAIQREFQNESVR